MSISGSSCWRFILTTVVLLELVALCGCPQDETLTLVSNLTRDRQTVESYVKQIKQDFQPSDPVYQEAKQRYLAAYSFYEGYLTALHLSIQTGVRGDLQGLAAQADAKSNDFVIYAGDNIHSRSMPPFLPAFSVAHVPPYVVSVKNDHRAMAAHLLYQAVQWKDWDAIT
jgi:hypothetical protein